MVFPSRQNDETSGSSWERVRPPRTTSTIPDRSERLRYQQYVISQTALKRPLAPIQELLAEKHLFPAVLDVGSGAGDWGRALGKISPHAQIIGFDSEEVERATSSLSNYQFRRGDPLHGLPFPSGQFIYVHQRLLGASIPFHHWPERVQELVRVTAPGGWIELMEGGLTFHRAGPATEQLVEWCHHLAQARGIDPSCLKDLRILLQTAKLLHLRSETIRLRVGGWAGRQGDLVAKALLAGVAALRPWLLAYVAEDHFDAVVMALPGEWDTFECLYEVYRFAGRRPGKDTPHVR